MPAISMFRASDDGRLRNAITASGERRVLPRDLMEIHGVIVTTPLRTAVDLGRLQPTADLRLAGMDAMLRLGRFTHDTLPRPRTQIPVLLDGVVRFHLDMGREEWLLAAEYDGEQWHGEADAAHDARRRAWVCVGVGAAIVADRGVAQAARPRAHPGRGATPGPRRAAARALLEHRRTFL